MVIFIRTCKDYTVLLSSPSPFLLDRGPGESEGGRRLLRLQSSILEAGVPTSSFDVVSHWSSLGHDFRG